MDSFTEIAEISVIPVIAIVALVGAGLASYYRLRRPVAIVLALIAVAAIAYAVIWTFLPG